MGAITYSIDRRMVECLAAALPVDVFVETGTYEGDSVEAVRTLFSEIHTIELSESLAAAARARFAGAKSVNVHQGDSIELLALLRRQLRDRPVIYWLDAHWCAGVEANGAVRAQCPLLGEIEAIGSLNSKSVVLIDDARLFLAPPPEPHAADDWPTLHEVLEALRVLSAVHELVVVNDTFAFVPKAAAPAFRSWAGHNGVDLLATFHRLGVLEEERVSLHAALDERLETINNLSARLAAMNRLERTIHRAFAVAFMLSRSVRIRRGR